MTLTPEAKALELVEKYYDYFTNYLNISESTKFAKQCALICVNEIIKSGKDVDEFADGYWFKVKQEIEKL